HELSGFAARRTEKRPGTPGLTILRILVGARGFEPPTPRSRTECSTRLSHAPTGRDTYPTPRAVQSKAGPSNRSSPLGVRLRTCYFGSPLNPSQRTFTCQLVNVPGGLSFHAHTCSV